MRTLTFLALAMMVLIITAFKVNQSQIIVEVQIEEMSFEPKVIMIKKGTTLRWINMSHNSHNVVSKKGDFRSPLLRRQYSTYEVTFLRSGQFNYHCAPHKSMGMTGQIIVK